MYVYICIYIEALHPITKGYPTNEHLQPQIPTVLNTYLKGAKTYRNLNSPAGLSNTTLEGTQILKSA